MNRPSAPEEQPTAAVPLAAVRMSTEKRSAPPLPWKPIAGAAGAIMVAAVLIVLIVRQGNARTEPELSPPAPEAQRPRTVTTDPQPNPRPRRAGARPLMLERLPPGMQVSLDGTSIGTVGPDGHYRIQASPLDLTHYSSWRDTNR